MAICNKHVPVTIGNPKTCPKNCLVRAIVKVAEGKGARVSDADVNAFASTGSIPQNLKGHFLKAATGRKLPDDVRAQFDSLLNAYYKTAQARQMQLESEFTDKANIYGFDPKKIVMKFRPKAEYGQVPNAPNEVGGIVEIRSDADFNKLPSGTNFKGPDGKVRVKP